MLDASDIRRRIEENDRTLPAAEYDAYVLSKGRDSVACAVRDVLSGVRAGYAKTDIVEVAMGTGIVTARLRQLSHASVVSCDIRSDWVQYAIQQGRTPADCVAIANFEHLPFADGSFDVWTGLAFLHHRVDPQVVYTEALRVLKPGGMVLLPWVKPKAGSVDREAALMVGAGLRVVRSEAWYLLAEKQAATSAVQSVRHPVAGQ